MDQPVTFIIIRKTKTIKGTEQALIHAFASENHPTVKGPTLEFTLKDSLDESFSEEENESAKETQESVLSMRNEVTR